MPRMGPGQDNTTGDRYTMDLGVEPDLGNLLQNLKVANELIDLGEKKFESIADIVGSMTQRLAQATRQTQLLVTETQRLQTSYQGIASAGTTLSNIGGMAMGGGYAGGMPGYFPGQMAFGGMPPASRVQTMPTSVVQDYGGGGAQEDIQRYAPPGPAQAPRMPNLAAVQWEAKAQLAGQLFGKKGTPGFISKLKGGFNAGSWRAGFGKPAGAAPGATNWGVDLAGAGAEEAAGGGFWGGVGGLAAEAAPYVGALYGAQKLYGTWATAQAESRRMAGITGGSAGIAGMFGGPVGGTAGLGIRAQVMNLINPGIDYGGLQEQAASAGYISGQGYEGARDYLYEAAKRGMSDTIDQLDLYQESVDKAGGSMSALVGAMDQMRMVASHTNASLTAMAQNYKANVENFVAMGMQGTAASTQAQIVSTAWARAGETNPALRNYGGVDMTNPYIRAGVASQLGVSYGTLGMQTYLHPGFAAQVPVAGEQVGASFLASVGFTPGMTKDQVAQHLVKTGYGDYFGQVLAQMGMIDPSMAGDTQTVLSYIQGAMQGRVAQGEAANRAELQGRNLSGMTMKVDMGHGAYRTQAMTASGYLNNMGLLTGTDHPIGQMYSQYLSRTGKTIPLLDRIAGGGAEEINNTYIKDANGMPVPLGVWMRQPGNMKKLSDPRQAANLQIATATDQMQGQMHYDATRGEMVSNTGRTTAKDLDYTAGVNFGGARSGQSDNVTGPSPGSQGVYDLGEHTITRLADAIATAENH